jgi:hypothetical protein
MPFCGWPESPENADVRQYGKIILLIQRQAQVAVIELVFDLVFDAAVVLPVSDIGDVPPPEGGGANNFSAVGACP